MFDKKPELPTLLEIFKETFRERINERKDNFIDLPKLEPIFPQKNVSKDSSQLSDPYEVELPYQFCSFVIAFNSDLRNSYKLPAPSPPFPNLILSTKKINIPDVFFQIISQGLHNPEEDDDSYELVADRNGSLMLIQGKKSGVESSLKKLNKVVTSNNHKLKDSVLKASKFTNKHCLAFYDNKPVLEETTNFNHERIDIGHITTSSGLLSLIKIPDSPIKCENHKTDYVLIFRDPNVDMVTFMRYMMWHGYDDATSLSSDETLTPEDVNVLEMTKHGELSLFFSKDFQILQEESQKTESKKSQSPLSLLNGK